MTRSIILSALLALSFAACQGTTGTLGDAGAKILPDTSHADPVNPSSSNRTYSVDVLLYNGAGVSTSDWENTEEILKSQGLSYQLINATELNAMTLDEIASFGMILVPGGSGGTIADNISKEARLRVRQAVRERGLGYVGFCAGAWVAVGPEATGNEVASYGLAVAPGGVLDYYWPDGNSSLVAAMVDVKFSSDGSTRKLVWWGGPQTPEWTGGVVARYSTGEPAISQTQAGNGFVVISGPHPEAPESWRATAGEDSDGLDYDIAVRMINAALKKQPM